MDAAAIGTAAIGTAKSALNSVVKTTTTAITNEIGLVLGVQEELFFIKEELQMMRAFLRVAKTENVKGEIVTTWINQVEELAFDVEDCLQEASVHLQKKNCLPVMCSVKKRDRIARQIRVLKTRIVDVSERNLRYKLIKKENGSHTYDQSASAKSIANVKTLLVGLDEPKRNLVELILKEDADVISVVGMGGLGKTTLVKEVYGCQELRDKFKCFAWVSVLHPFNMEEFIESLGKQIPYEPQKADNEGGMEDENKKKSGILPKKTKERITQYLINKKYFIVLDDLSSLLEWNKIEDMLPVNNGRRIIVTTRDISPLAESISHSRDNIYVIKELSETDAIDLFYKAVYKTPNYPLVSDEGSSSTEITKGDSKAQKQCITNTITEEDDREIKEDPPHENKCNIKNGSSSTEITEENSEVLEQCITKDMQTQAGLIIKRCGRLPLAIVTIGSHLATKPKTSSEWNIMLNHLSSKLANNGDLGKLNNVLNSSYDCMPHHLKPSLLYLSVFHNHKEIRRSRIIRRWMADGYVMEDPKRTAEEVGKGYFYDLMGRSLIQPSQMSTIVNDNVKKCNIHDMMYELILSKAVDDNIMSVLDDENLITMTDKVRHLVITGESCTRDKVQKRVKLSHMRSLSIFGEVGDYLSYPRMKLVRVLDLEGTLNLNDGDLRNIGKLRHLKYLGLRGTKIAKLPNSLGKLSELETLDIRNTDVLLLPAGLTKLHKLSYLRAGSNNYFYHPLPINYYLGHAESTTVNWQKKVIDKCSPTIRGKALAVSDWVRSLCIILCCLIPLLPCLCLEVFEQYNIDRHSSGVRVPRGIGKLRSLNIVGTIDIAGSKSLAKEIQNLTKLRKLAVIGITNKNGKTLAKVIDGLKYLRSLFLSAQDESGLRCCLDSVSSPPKYLQSLKLYNPLGELPDWISSLENLEKLHLRNTKLTGEIKAIEKLPNLKILHMLNYTFVGLQKLCFGLGTFPMLQVLILGDWGKSVSIEETALKRLELLKIINWSFRKGGISGLGFLGQLKEMEVEGFSRFNEGDREFMKNIQEQLKKLPKEPILKVL